jgi:hypothetical protein
MKFVVLGRDVNVEWNHLAVSFLSLIAYALIIFIVALLPIYLFYMPLKYASELGGFGVVLVQGLSDYGTTIASIIGAPFKALVLLLAATWLYKMAKDAVLCRSLAGAYFFVEVGIYLVFFIPVTFLFLLDPLALPPRLTLLSQLLGLIINIVGDAASAILLYLWLLAIAAPDRQKAENTVAPAALFGLAMVALSFLPLLLDVTSGAVRVDFGSAFATQETAIYFLSKFVFGFIILYYLKGKKLDDAAYIFAALIVASPLITMLDRLVMPGTLDLWSTLIAMVQVVLLYGLSRIDLKDIL